jgi:hypothetical protein
MLNRKALFVIIIANFLIASHMLIGFFFMRFLHYRSQNQYLNPTDYEVQVLLPSDYEKLSNPDAGYVTLSNGSQSKLNDIGRQHLLTKHKVIDDGRYYVLTTIKGTAPFFPRWLGDFIIVFPWSIIGLIAAIIILRSNRPTPQNTTA